MAKMRRGEWTNSPQHTREEQKGDGIVQDTNAEDKLLKVLALM